MSAPCENCGSVTRKVIYFGLPGILCQNQGCNLLTGLAAYVPEFVQHLAWGPDGACFMVYETGYWPALWRWLKG